MTRSPDTDSRSRYLEIEGIREAAEQQDRLARSAPDPTSRSEHETQAAGHWKRYERELARDQEAST